MMTIHLDRRAIGAMRLVSYARFLSKMVLCVKIIARCTLFIPEKCNDPVRAQGVSPARGCAHSQRILSAAASRRQHFLIHFFQLS
jgi:hypothetical protein